MADKFFSNLILAATKKIFGLQELTNFKLENPKSLLIVRQHNQLGDLIASTPFYKALKEKYPGVHITVMAASFNYHGLVKNKHIDELFIFDKSRLFDPEYFSALREVLKKNYDAAIVPVVVSISFTSNLLCRLSNSKLKIGPRSLDGKENKSKFLFNVLVDVDWRKYPDSNVSERNCDIMKPFGLVVKDLKAEIFFNGEDEQEAEEFLRRNHLAGRKNIGFHVGAGKAQNRWALKNYIKVIKTLKEKFDAGIYFTGSSTDLDEITYIKERAGFEIPVFLNRSINQVAALISKSDLFITNDTGIMHTAGTTDTPQISIFGPTNPFNWAPAGRPGKYFLKNSDLIDDVSPEEVLQLCSRILNNE